MLPDSRACTKCGLDKPLSEFSKAPRGKFGRKASCKSCDADRHRNKFVPAVADEEARRARYTRHQAGPKTCTKCGVAKERSEFGKVRDGKYGPLLKSICKVCQAAAARQWIADNTERSLENRRRWNLKTTYGLSVTEYNDMLRAQGGVCAICGEDEPASHGRTGKKFRLSVDHCHESGAIRGLLCQKCNRAIGLLKEDPQVMRRALSYLLRHRNRAG